MNQETLRHRPSPPGSGGPITKRRSAAALALLLGIGAGARAIGWSDSASGAPNGRRDASMAYDEAREVAVLFGGLELDWYAGNTTMLFDGSVWREGPAAPPLLAPRTSFAMAYDPRRSVVMVFGGGEYVGAHPAFNDTWELDASGWHPGAAAEAGLTPRAGCRMAYDSRRGRMVLVGGKTAMGSVAEVWEHDGTAWVRGVAPPAGFMPRQDAAVAYDEARGRLVVFGGYDATTSTMLGDTWEYDGQSWNPGPPAPPGLLPRFDAGMAFDPGRGRILLFGGYLENVEVDATSWLYDGTAWVPGPETPQYLYPRAGMAMCADSRRRKVVLFGGGRFGPGGGRLDDTWELDATGWSQPLPLFPVARSAAAMVYDSNRGAGVMFGGFNEAAGLLDDTWELDGTEWRRGAAAPPGLLPRSSAPAAYDSARGRMVMIGGWAPPHHADTWEYDGSSWLPGPSAPFTEQRFWGSMAFDPLRGVVVHYGGIHFQGQDHTYFGDTWEYDGTAWTAGAPSPADMLPRYGAAMAWDPELAAIVLMGGEAPYQTLRDVWIYDGTSWRRGPEPTVASPRLAHTMVYDLARRRLIFFGGTDDPGGGGTTFSDVWELGGGTWSLGAAAPAGLDGRRNHVSFYDDARRRTVVHGGLDVSSSQHGDAWEYGAVHSALVAGAGHGLPNPCRVVALDEAGQAAGVDLVAYGAGSWGVGAAGAMLEPAPFQQIATGPGPGAVHGPHVRAFRTDGTALAKVSFFAYATLRFGVGVAATALDLDAFDEVVTAAGPGEVFGPHVRGFDVDGGSPSPLPRVSFFAYATPRYGALADGGDLDGDGTAELVVAPGPGPTFAAQVRGFDVDASGVRPLAKVSFVAFPSASYGARPASGDVDGDGAGEIAVASGAGPSTLMEVRGFDVDGGGVDALPGFVVGPGPMLYGARIGLGDLAGGSECELVWAPGPDPSAAATLDAHAYDGIALVPVVSGAQAFPGQRFGVNVGVGNLGL